jgi:hypothetical protein
MCLSVSQDLTYVIHRSLNRIGLPFLFSLGDENCADHISGGGAVDYEDYVWFEEQWMVASWCDE